MAEGENDFPIIFLGVADHLPQGQGPFPVNPINIFQLSQVKRYIIYPASVAGTYAIFLLNQSVIEALKQEPIEIVYRSANGKEVWTVSVSPVEGATVSSTSASGPTSTPPPVFASTHGTQSVGDRTQTDYSQLFISNKKSGWGLIHIPLPTNVMVPEPSLYSVEASCGGRKQIIGELDYACQKVPPFTAEEIVATQAKPDAVKAVRLVLGCQYCPTKIMTYAALQRDSQAERDGFTFHTELGDVFACQCGKTSFPLTSIKENLHALLGKDPKFLIGQVDFIALYAHSAIMKIVERFNVLLDKHKDEATFQKFIEEHPPLLAQFHPKKLYIKPTVLGKYQPDFVVLDAQQKLIFIELERPSMKLFLKKDGHPTAELMQAYGQVRDWLHEHEKHPAAVLENLGLRVEEVMAVRGAVVAGRTKGEKPEHMQRHRSRPVYDDVEFYTLDDLSTSLQEISRQLA